MDLVQTREVPSAGTSVSVNLWRRQPAVLDLRAAYPGARLIEARFLADGALGFTANSGARPSLSQNSATDELWQLDATTGSLEPVSLASSSEPRVSAVAPSPDGRKLAYAMGGPVISSSLWPTSSASPAP